MASVTENCIFKAITLGDGETFVLPPGAVLLGATDSSLISSSCLDQVIPDTELKCYEIKWILNKDPEGEKSVHVEPALPFPATGIIHLPNIKNAWEDDDGDATTITIDKISVGGVVFTVGVNCRDFNAIEAAIAGSSTGSALLERKYKHSEFTGGLTGPELVTWGSSSKFNSGFHIFEFFFKTLDDIAPGVYFEIGGGNGNIASLASIFPVELADCADYPTTTDVTC